MRKNRIYAGIFFMVCFCLAVIGCERNKKEFVLTSLAHEKDCMLCGDGEKSFKSIYSHYPGVGLLCLDDWRMIEIQPYVNGWIKDDAASYVWGDVYSVQIDRIMERGISLVRYTSDEENTLDLEGLSEKLCSDCIEKVKECVHIYGEHTDRKEKAVCLADLSTMELYGIQQSFQYYIFDDHYVQASCQGDTIQLTVFQTSEDPLDHGTQLTLGKFKTYPDTWHESQIVLE